MSFQLNFRGESNQRHKDFQSTVPLYIVELTGFSARLVPMVLGEIHHTSKFFVKKWKERLPSLDRLIGKIVF